MSRDGLLTQLSDFYKVARHFWGRCPYCERLFRLPDARITYGDKPPRDWLSRVERDQKALALGRSELESATAGLRNRMIALDAAERDVARLREQIERDATKRALCLAKSKPEVAVLLEAARREGVERSRSSIVGHFLERLAPFLKRFASPGSSQPRKGVSQSISRDLGKESASAPDCSIFGFMTFGTRRRACSRALGSRCW